MTFNPLYHYLLVRVVEMYSLLETPWRKKAGDSGIP
jgi:hypothetical protein